MDGVGTIFLPSYHAGLPRHCKLPAIDSAIETRSGVYWNTMFPYQRPSLADRKRVIMTSFSRRLACPSSQNALPYWSMRVWSTEPILMTF